MSRLLTLALFLLGLPALQGARPNLVFLLTDDQCLNSLGCYGNAEVKTPHIDSLAKDGIAFDRHYDSTAICMASRANIMTGNYEFKHGCNFEHGPLLREHWVQSYPMLLRKSGYQTAIAGKIGFTVAARAGAKGILPEDDFDAWGAGPGQTHFQTAKNKSMAKYADKYPHVTRAYGAFGADFIGEASKSKTPFCLSISFKAPHRPATPDPQDKEVYAGKSFSRPPNFGRQAGAHFSLQSRQGRQFERFFSWNYADKYDEVMAIYHQQIYAVDVAVGMIREALKKHKVADNTVVIFTSDNGFFCGAHGYGSKVLPYEEGSCVPLIIFDPRHANSGKGLRSDALTGNVDLGPTLLDLAGVKEPKGIDGKSLVPLYANPRAEVRKTLPLINVWGPKAVHSLAVVTKTQKYVYWPWAAGEFEATEELYDMTGDRLEMVNLAGKEKNPKGLEAMRAHYDSYVKQWKSEAVPYHNYRPFGVFFDRSAPWEEKAKAIRRRK